MHAPSHLVAMHEIAALGPRGHRIQEELRVDLLDDELEIQVPYVKPRS